VGKIGRKGVDGEVGFLKIWWGRWEEKGRGSERGKWGCFKVKEVNPRSIDRGKKWKGR
jgi:hypothetical protein